MKTPRFAFVGSTHEVHPWLMTALERAGRLEAICGSDAEQAVERHHARWAFSHVDELLRDSEPDGVVVGLPIAQRSEVIRACLARGIGVLVPGAPGLARECRRTASLAKLASRVVLAATPARFSPALLLARRLIEAGRMGRPISLWMTSAWRAVSLQEFPVARDQLYEALDLVQTLLGPIRRMQAIGHADGVLSVQGHTEGPVLMTMMLHARSAAESAGMELEIRSGDGTRLTLDREGRLICGNGSRLDAYYGPSRVAADPVSESGCLGLVREFARQLHVGSGGFTELSATTTRLAEQLSRRASRETSFSSDDPAVEPALPADRNSLSAGPL